MKYNGFEIQTDTDITGTHIAVARIPGIISFTTEHQDTEDDAIYNVQLQINKYLNF